MVYTLPGSKRLTATRCLPEDSRIFENPKLNNIAEDIDDVEPMAFATVGLEIAEVLLLIVLIVAFITYRLTTAKQDQPQLALQPLPLPPALREAIMI